MSERVALSKYGYSILQIETKLLCNMACKFCAYPLVEDKGTELDTDVVLNVLDQVDAADPGLQYICFSQYNEPMMDKRIFDLIKTAKQKGFKVLTITNGLLLNDKEIRERLADASPTYVKISLQTLTQELFKEARGVNKDFGVYKQGIFELLKLAETDRLKSDVVLDLACNFLSPLRRVAYKVLGLETGDPSVPDYLSEVKKPLLEFLRELKASSDLFTFSPEQIVASLSEDTETEYIQQPPIRLGKRVTLKVKRFVHGRRFTKFEPIAYSMGCATRILGVLSSGSVVPCCLAYDDHLKMGNVKKEPLGAILARSAKFINGIRTGDDLSATCRKCLGAPTKRGARLKSFRALLMKQKGRLAGRADLSDRGF